jgi:myosin heavy subunit
MTLRRTVHEPADCDDSGEHVFPILVAETARNASSPALPAKPGEEKISLFWRVFGGTLVSIAALVAITAYQAQSNSINDLRNELARGNEARAQMVKNDEFTSARTKIWDKFQELQKDTIALQQVKDRVGLLEEQIKAGAATQKDVQGLQTTISAMQEKAVLRDQQFKQMDDEKKELVKELQTLRERLAKLEAARETPPANPKASDTNADNAGKR